MDRRTPGARDGPVGTSMPSARNSALDCDLREYATVGRVLLALEWRTLLRGGAE